MQERNKTLFVIRNPQPATCGVYDGTPYRGNQGRAFWPGYLVFYRFGAKRFEKDYQLRKQRQGCNQGD